MDTSTFVEELFSALVNLEKAEQIAIQTEGPVINGRVYLSQKRFLSFYYNRQSST